MQTRYQTRYQTQLQQLQTTTSRPRRANIKTPNYVEYDSEPELESKVRLYRPVYDVDIDFDEASLAWRANKRLVGEGHFAYVDGRRRKTREEAAEHILTATRRSPRLAAAAAAASNAR